MPESSDSSIYGAGRAAPALTALSQPEGLEPLLSVDEVTGVLRISGKAVCTAWSATGSWLE